ncbi:5-formyltetrahydrofolate cyclo-ligase-like protein [Trichodelitschia bisporula]|uniref:5-formyltetrahydrofolate cyclo-ligase n=1 Tax=Trichodelitschia bisporula TaxID=703511 RepID=A0A6G1HIT2_9PEZI|nr:5-formyltetrahydrofolate cyclo-ligase-like protein [Trichodelitschia bisporula]
MTLRVAKKDLRTSLKQILSALPASSITSQSANITSAFLALPEYQSATRISVYLSMPSGEVQTDAIVRDALRMGKQVFVPYIYRTSSPPSPPRNVMDMLEVHSVEDYEAFARDKWGIPTVDAKSVAGRHNCFGGRGRTEGPTESVDGSAADIVKDAALDLVVTPGVAFDTGFGRLGHGMGFYDNFFARCSSRGKRPFLAGLALSEQLLPADRTVPMEAYDVRLDALVIGDGRVLRR